MKNGTVSLWIFGLLVLLAVPLVVVAGTVSVPNTFVNGAVADADEVNANFDSVETAVNDNDSRITGVETDAATAQTSADTAVADAVAAQSTANTAQSAAGANTAEISNLSAEVVTNADLIANQSAAIAALQASVAVLQGGVVVWQLGGVDESCDTVCLNYNGSTCSLTTLQGVASDAKLESIATSVGVSCTIVYQHTHASTPFLNTGEYLGCFRSLMPAASTCDSVSPVAALRRFCPCLLP